jgi:transposase
MNRINVSLQQSIIALVERGWSKRRIARELQLDRATVTRQLLATANAATNPAHGSGEAGLSKPATNPAQGAEDQAPNAATNPAHGAGEVAAANAASNPAVGARPGPPSLCAPFAAEIEAAVAGGLSAQRIYQDLISEHGFGGGYSSVKQFVRRLTARSELPFRRMECEPGAEMQVDFGTGAWVVAEGKRRRPHLFRAVLSHSRKGYSEVVWRQDTETLIRCLENAFRAFGGVTATLVPDNLKAAVLWADWFDPELNPKLRDFCAHYGTALLPTKPAMPRHKGKVEAGVKFAQANALKGRQFDSLAAENAFLTAWERTVADTRIHGTIRQQVGAFFTQAEQAKLQALPATLFPCFVEAKRTVHRDGHLAYDHAYYSAPPEYVGREVWVRAETRLVRLYNLRFEAIAVHVRAERGRFATARRPYPQSQARHHRARRRLSARTLRPARRPLRRVGRGPLGAARAPRYARPAGPARARTRTSHCRTRTGLRPRRASRTLAAARRAALGARRRTGRSGRFSASPSSHPRSQPLPA